MYELLQFVELAGIVRRRQVQHVQSRHGRHVVQACPMREGSAREVQHDRRVLAAVERDYDTGRPIKPERGVQRVERTIQRAIRLRTRFLVQRQCVCGCSHREHRCAISREGSTSDSVWIRIRRCR